mmetsp:Transcript_20336/g.28173  ORF Transcript_20336/g.28173 Transcript_20336/m.28173 type:complete len:538 (+) Transcript_20336:106-1719(+)|eukprot:CAMPEP_0196575708 /NCGR_PEP_ID=MMETSP1081-20130531/5136_1 /TAXON_ID=36882 /ORGANISM="Pyramimonas amylifera, Strain CCMP720" /LENGTH=537 /DNA_ID=CAMNT_0041894093 /DNA_START=95 /DNA_END=1708 /DNA_ORIENTATION=-
MTLFILPVLAILLFGTGIGFIQQRESVPPVTKPAENGVIADFGNDFMFGLATAPAHVEDDLDDAWLEFANRGKVAAWSNHHEPHERLKFWSEPEVELELAREAGAKLFRLGVDWQRVMPKAGSVNEDALQRYSDILTMVQERGMKVMLTLFHHSAPTWIAEKGGWPEASTAEEFLKFGKLVVDKMGSKVDYWTIFNEPHVYTLLTHCAGVWPPGKPFSTLNALVCFSPFGAYAHSLSNMAGTHKELYAYIHSKKKSVSVGVAHHVGHIQAHHSWDLPAALYNGYMSTFWFVDLVVDKCDFIGLNYYGQEFISGDGVAILPSEEYSDAGRGVYPDGLYHILMRYHRKYPVKYMITENGVSDSLDVIRGSYLIEHLLAIKAAMNSGVDVGAYVFWTISDNWEWADGYCPKFGLVAVNRTNGLAREKRPSFNLFQSIAETGKISQQQRAAAWSHVRNAASSGLERPFCRQLEVGGMTGAFGIDEPVPRKVNLKDWRFGEYEVPHLSDSFGEYAERIYKTVVNAELLSMFWTPRSPVAQEL